MLRRLGLRKFGPMILRFNFIRYEYVRSPEGASRQFLPMAWNPVQAGCPHISPEAMGTVELLPPAGAKP
jgi:hypothetical protein